MEYIKRFLWVIQLMIMIPVHILVFIFICIPVIVSAQILEIVLVWPAYYVITGEWFNDDYKMVVDAANDFLFGGEKFTFKRWH